MKPTWVFPFVVLLIGSQACGSLLPTPEINPAALGGAAEAPTEVAPVAKTRDKVESAGIALTVFSVESLAETSSFFKFSAGNILVVCAVTLGPAASDKAPYNPFHFKVKDAYGFERSASAACLAQP